MNQGLRNNLFYSRDLTGNEIDVLIDQPQGAIPVEIKSSSTFNVDFQKEYVIGKSSIRT